MKKASRRKSRLLRRSFCASEGTLWRRHRVSHALDLVVRETLAQQFLHDFVGLFFTKELHIDDRYTPDGATLSVSESGGSRRTHTSFHLRAKSTSYLDAERNKRDQHCGRENPDPSRGLAPRLKAHANENPPTLFSVGIRTSSSNMVINVQSWRR